jgi:glycolate oxidase FAD binding subunit
VIAVKSQELREFAEHIGDDGPVAVEGCRTRWDAGGGATGSVRLVAAPVGVIDYQAEEMTVRVRAGTSVAALHAILAESGQRTALPERGGTVGGALAVGENSEHVRRRGRVRDCALQVCYVSAEGRLVSGGGPTVKNVTGYDLPRLLVGSLGILGCLAEVILRTQPIGVADAWLVGETDDAFTLSDALPYASAVLWDGSRTWVHLEGHREDLLTQEAILARRGSFVATDHPPAFPPLRCSLAPSALRDLHQHEVGPFVAEIGVGILHVSRRHAPPRPTPGVDELAMRVKNTFDPTGRLNPGRSPGRKAS